MHGVSYYTQLTLNFVDVVSFVDYLREHFVSEGNFSVNDTSYTWFLNDMAFYARYATSNILELSEAQNVT